jgi:two-component system, NtrC family, sensor kinase
VSRTESGTRRELGTPRASLRGELLFQLACLAAAAVLLALWTVLLLQLPFFDRFHAGWLFALVAIDLLLFVLLGRFLLERFVMHPLSATADAATRIAAGDHDMRVPQGQTREMEAVSSAVNDLTDQLLQNQYRLADNVRSLDETNRLLLEAQRELVQAEKLAAIGQLAAGIAHEVGNPLGSVLGYAGVLRRRGVDSALVDGIEREVQRIDSIVRGLLDYARPAARERLLVDANESVRSAVEMLRRGGRLAGVVVDYQLQEDLPPVLGAPQALEQIWVNLLLNAESAMQGKGTVVLATRHMELEADRREPIRRSDDPPGVDYSHLRRMRELPELHRTRLEPGSEIVRITIRDTGPGIPSEYVDSIFDPFFTTKAPGEGTGLGLAIVASTVADLRGEIVVGENGGAGAAFVISLPVARSLS